MNLVSNIYDIKEKMACITLDFEMDYGHRVGEFNILHKKKDLNELANLFSDLDIPVSTFIRTDLLINYPSCIEIIKKIAKDYHAHSHSHSHSDFKSQEEISASSEIFEKQFGYKPIGYRAPYGVLHDKDIDIIKQYGFKFSSSVFPSFRPGKFNNLSFPNTPFMYDNNVIELPFAAVPKLRYTISLSYLKLLGFSINKAMFSMFGLPNVLVFDSHLHDYIIDEKSFSKLPLKMKMAWGINKYAGITYFKDFIRLLRKNNYKFMTMTDLYNLIYKSHP